MPDTTTLEKRSDLDLSHKVVLYPSFAFRKADGWKALIAGFVYEDGQDTMRQRMFLSVLKQVLQVEEAQLKSSEIFQERIRGFLADPQRAKTVVVRLADQQLVQLRRSRRNGHFRGHTLFNVEDADNGHFQVRDHGRINCDVLTNESDGRHFSGRIELLPMDGMSVISDIDDTIKISQVAQRRQLLKNTFLNPFAAVPGMAELYQQWKDAGVAFHYVSSSPWQLYEPLAQLLSEQQFPEGSFHLRTIRFSDPSVLRLVMPRKRNKYQVIKTIFRLFPQRSFLLVGDSAEKDPEIYGAIARKFPAQIQRILIRRVAGNRWTRKRVAKAFRKVPKELWQTFRDPSSIKPLDLLP